MTRSTMRGKTVAIAAPFTPSPAIKINNQSYPVSTNGATTINIPAAGTYTITKDTTNTYLYYLSFIESWLNNTYTKRGGMLWPKIITFRLFHYMVNGRMVHLIQLFIPYLFSVMALQKPNIIVNNWQQHCFNRTLFCIIFNLFVEFIP